MTGLEGASAQCGIACGAGLNSKFQSVVADKFQANSKGENLKLEEIGKTEEHASRH